jgi:preprotein translocase subunit SecA
MIGNTVNSKNLTNALVEILTGEGKSIVLIGAALYLALNGYKVYITCFSKYLIKKDCDQFQKFIDLFFPNK